MSAKPKTDYTGRGINFQIRLSDDEHRELDRQRKAAGFSTLADYFRAMLRQGDRKQIQIHSDPIRPENKDIHRRIETLWNSLTDHDRAQLERLLDAFAPKIKGKRTA